jgi:hypothetical protein
MTLSNRFDMGESSPVNVKFSFTKMICTSAKDSCWIVTDAPALALEVGQDSSSLPLLDGLDLKLGQLIAAGGAANQNASMT